MKTIVITGSTSGIGLGLAEAFLSLGCAVAISGRSLANLDSAYVILTERYGGSRVLAHLCDVRFYDQVVGLWDTAREKYGRIDIWINNAGAACPETLIWDYSPDVIERIVATNITGALYGCRFSREMTTFRAIFSS
jgi:NAD(P)-dependent dehydrogenase (short-subunit alcohol dehydrogenase family)